MKTRPVDALFVRFRESGDPAALAAVFDEVAPEILRLAGHLVRDPHAAEDLLQQTFLTAIEHAASFDVDRRVVPWLIGILVQLTRRHHRARARRPDGTRLPARVSEEPHAEAQAAELSQTLERVIGGLAVPYQPVLALHLRHGLSSHEIAAALRRPQGTVRTQLMRGLEALRRALPVGLAGGVVATVGGAQATLASVRATVLAAVPEAVAVAVGGIGSVGSVGAFGGLFMAKKLVVAVAAGVVFAAGGIWMWVTQPTRADEQQAGLPAAVAADPVATATATAPAVAGQEVRSVETRRTPTTGSLQIRVLWSDRTPATHLAVRWSPTTGDRELLERWSEVDPAGDLRLDALPPGQYSICADRGGCARPEVRAGETTPAELVIPAGVQLDCLVVDKDGKPIAEADVWLSAEPSSVRHGRVMGRTASDGTLTLRDVEPKRVASASGGGFPWCAGQLVPDVAGSRHALRFELRGTSRSLRGRVLDPEGRPVPDCTVAVGPGQASGGAGQLLGNLWSLTLPPPITLRTDATGSFRADRIPWSAFPVWARAPGFVAAGLAAKLEDGREGEVVLRLTPGGRLSGRVLDRDGNPCQARIHVDTKGLGPGSGAEYLRPAWAWHMGGSSDRDGAFLLDELVPGPFAVRVDGGEKGTAKGEFRIDAGQELTWHATLTPGGEITGVVLEEGGAALSGWQVRALLIDGPRPRQVQLTKTDAQGRFVLTRCEAVDHTIEALAPEGGLGHTAASVESVRPGGPPLTIHVPAEQMSTAVVIGIVRDPKGAALPGTSMTLFRVGTLGSVSGKTEADGRFRIGPFPQGTYRLHALHDAFGRMQGDAFTVEPRETRDLGELRFGEPGSFVAVVTGPDGKPASGGMMQLQDPDSPYQITFFLKDGVARSPVVRPGRYVFAPFRGDWPLTGWPTEIRAGEETRLEVQIVKGVERAVRFTSASEKPPIPVTFRWQNDKGELLALHQMRWDRAEPPPTKRWFAPGAYRVEVVTGSGLSAETAFVVTAAETSAEEIVIRMP